MDSINVCELIFGLECGDLIRSVSGGPIRSEKMDSSNNLTLVQQPDTPNNRARTGTGHYFY